MTTPLLELLDQIDMQITKHVTDWGADDPLPVSTVELSRLIRELRRAVNQEKSIFPAPISTEPRNTAKVTLAPSVVIPEDGEVELGRMYEAAKRAGAHNTEGRTFEEWRERVSDYGLDDAKQALLAEKEGRSESSLVRILGDALEVVVNTCKDVTELGRFAKNVDPVGWVAGLQAHAEAALAQREEGD